MSSTKHKKYPFVSIIIPVKNEEQYIKECLDVVMCLDYPKDRYEIIVVDNDSSDNTKDIVSKFQRVLLVEAQGTIGVVRNYGAKKAKGEFLAFLDGDCIPDKKWLDIGWNHLRNNKDISCIGFAISKPNPNDSWVEKTWYKMSSGSKYKGTYNVRWLSSFNLILKKESFLKVGGFDESLETCEDADLGYKLSRTNKLVFSDEITVKHLGNAKTLEEFFAKELWRGRGNLKSFLQNKNKIKNFPSVFIPIIYASTVLEVVILSLLYVIGIKYHLVIYLSILFIIIVPFFLSLIKQKYNLIQVKKMAILYFVYLIARGLAAFGFQIKDKSWIQTR